MKLFIRPVCESILRHLRQTGIYRVMIIFLLKEWQMKFLIWLGMALITAFGGWLCYSRMNEMNGIPGGHLLCWWHCR